MRLREWRVGLYLQAHQLADTESPCRLRAAGSQGIRERDPGCETQSRNRYFSERDPNFCQRLPENPVRQYQRKGQSGLYGGRVGSACVRGYHLDFRDKPAERQHFEFGGRSAAQAQRRYGQSRRLMLSCRGLRDPVIRGGSQSYIGIFQDISERKRAEEELHRLAFYDVLTGLPNRHLLQVHVQQALAFAARKSTRCAICIMDLDSFKQINDTLGHKVGDLLLKEVSRRLSGLLRKTDVVAYDTSTEPDASGNQIARLGGDEFIFLLTELSDPAALERIAARVLKEIAQPYKVQGTVLNITCSIGIARYPEDGVELDELMMRADKAMYEAKRAGKNTYAFSIRDGG